MALKPSSLRMLEDEFVCRCSYFADEAGYVNYGAKNHEVWLRARLLEDERTTRRHDKRSAKA